MGRRKRWHKLSFPIVVLLLVAGFLAHEKGTGRVQATTTQDVGSLLSQTTGPNPAPTYPTNTTPSSSSSTGSSSSTPPASFAGVSAGVSGTKNVSSEAFERFGTTKNKQKSSKIPAGQPPVEINLSDLDDTECPKPEELGLSGTYKIVCGNVRAINITLDDIELASTETQTAAAKPTATKGKTSKVERSSQGVGGIQVIVYEQIYGNYFNGAIASTVTNNNGAYLIPIEVRGTPLYLVYLQGGKLIDSYEIPPNIPNVVAKFNPGVKMVGKNPASVNAGFIKPPNKVKFLYPEEESTECTKLPGTYVYERGNKKVDTPIGIIAPVGDDQFSKAGNFNVDDSPDDVLGEYKLVPDGSEFMTNVKVSSREATMQFTDMEKSLGGEDLINGGFGSGIRPKGYKLPKCSESFDTGLEYMNQFVNPNKVGQIAPNLWTAGGFMGLNTDNSIFYEESMQPLAKTIAVCDGKSLADYELGDTNFPYGAIARQAGSDWTLDRSSTIRVDNRTSNDSLENESDGVNERPREKKAEGNNIGELPGAARHNTIYPAGIRNTHLYQEDFRPAVSKALRIPGDTVSNTTYSGTITHIGTPQKMCSCSDIDPKCQEPIEFDGRSLDVDHKIAVAKENGSLGDLTDTDIADYAFPRSPQNLPYIVQAVASGAKTLSSLSADEGKALLQALKVDPYISGYVVLGPGELKEENSQVESGHNYERGTFYNKPLTRTRFSFSAFATFATDAMALFANIFSSMGQVEDAARENGGMGGRCIERAGNDYKVLNRPCGADEFDCFEEEIEVCHPSGGCSMAIEYRKYKYTYGCDGEVPFVIDTETKFEDPKGALKVEESVAESMGYILAMLTLPETPGLPPIAKAVINKAEAGYSEVDGGENVLVVFPKESATVMARARLTEISNMFPDETLGYNNPFILKVKSGSISGGPGGPGGPGGGGLIDCSADKEMPPSSSAASSVASRAYSIAQNLERGFWCYFNKSPDYPELWNEAKFIADPSPVHSKNNPALGPVDLFWCTWLVIKSYQETYDPSFPAITGVTTMYSLIKNGNVEISYTDKPPTIFTQDKYVFNPRASTPIDQVKSGDMIFYKWAGNSNPDHVGIVYSVTPDGIYTVESNSGMISVFIPSTSDGYVSASFTETPGLTVYGFGSLK